MGALEQPGPRNRDWLSVKELAAEFRVSKMTVYRILAAGGLPAVRIGRQLFVPGSALDELAAAALAAGGTIDAAEWCKGGES